LTWRAPLECPSAVDVAQRTEQTLGAGIESTEPLRVDARVTLQQNRWFVALSIQYAGGTGTREVDFETCDEVGNFVALTVALALDPDAGAPPPEPDPVQAKPDPKPAATPAPEESQAPPSKNKWFASAGMRLATGVLPGLAVAPSLQVGRTFGRFSTSLGAFFFPTQAYDNFSATDDSLRMSFWGGTLRGCYSPFDQRVFVGVCVATQWGAVSARGSASGGPAAEGGTAVFGAVVPGLEGGIHLSRNAALYFQTDLAIVVESPEFVLTDGTEVFRSHLGFQGDFGFRVIF
jgi:hypothetical protein